MADGPVGYWPLDQSSGATTAPDATGHGLTATLMGGAGFVVDSGNASQVSLDGTNGRLVVAPNSRLTLTNAFSVELLVRTSTVGKRLIGAAHDPWELYVGDDGVLELRLLGQRVRGFAPIADGNWHFVAATWDGDRAIVYYDGGWDNFATVTGHAPSSADGLTIGAHPNTGAFVSGDIDDVAVFDYALSGGQVASHARWRWQNMPSNAGVVAFTVASNPVGTARDTVFTIASEPVPVVQTGIPPVITSVSPTAGAAGTSVTIAGSGFGSVQGNSTIWLGTMPGNILSWTDTQVTATVAIASRSGTAQIRREDRSTSNAVAFGVSATTVTSVTLSGGGTVVTVTGSGFGSTQGTGQWCWV